jgi:dihydrolipoamide dehydrogenase
LELGSIWSRLGSEVTILESEKTFLPMLDARLSRQIAREFKEQGLNINLGCNISEIKNQNSCAEIKFLCNDSEQTIHTDKVIIAIGREPNTNNLSFEDPSILDDNGFIEVNEFCQTKLENIWAIGDVVRGPSVSTQSL